MIRLRAPAGAALLAGLAAATACAGARADTLLVVNQGDASLSLVDPARMAVVGRVAEGETGGSHAHEAAVSGDGRIAFLPVYGDSGVGRPGVDGRTLLFVDLASRRVVERLDFGRGLRPHLAVTDPASGRLYVTTELDRSVTVLDPERRKILARIPTGAAQSHMLALSHDGRFGYTANVSPGSVSVLDLQARRLLGVIPLAKSVQRIAVSRDDRLVFTSDADAPRLAIVDAASRRLLRWAPLPARGYGAAATPDGERLLIALPSLNAVGVLNLKTFAIERTVPVGRSPQEVLIRPDGAAAYVSCAAEGAVYAVSLADWRVLGSARTGPGADGLAWSAR